jgi:hypothetical protein
VSSIHDERVVLDTNQFVFALRDIPEYSSCRELLFQSLERLRLYLPLQILIELQRNLSAEELRRLFTALRRARSVDWDYAPAPRALVELWHQQGAKKGDAVIAAHLEAAGIAYLVSENRHFLAEIEGLPFEVLTSDALLRRLGE